MPDISVKLRGVFLKFFLSTQVFFPSSRGVFFDIVRIKSVKYNVNNVHALSLEKYIYPETPGRTYNQNRLYYHHLYKRNHLYYNDD